MNKLYQNILTLLLVIFISSCEQDLEPHLYGTINPRNAFLSSEDLEAATTSIYNELRSNGWGGYMFSGGSPFVMDEVATGEWTIKWSQPNFLSGAWTSGGQIYGFYRNFSRAVTKCTYMIAQFEASPVEAEIRENYIAQVRALRAFFMYDIYRFYGPMPLIIDSEMALHPDPDYKPTRPPASEVENFITTELREAANTLPVSQAQYGRITKGATLAYLLKFYMHKKEWQKAVEISDEIIGLGYYQLEPNYADIFSSQNEGNRELIFVVTGVPIKGYGNHVYANILPGDFQSPYGNSVTGWNGHRMPWAFYDSFDENDTRKELIWDKYQTKSGTMIDLRASGDIGALPLKYGIDPDATGIWAGNDKVLDRYAEVLISKAEALNELNGPNQESIDLINTIRSRAYGAYGGQDQVVLSEEFDVTPTWNDSRSSYDFEKFFVKQFEDMVSMQVERYSTGSPDNPYSLHLNVANSGSDWSKIQVRINGFQVERDAVYSVSFKVLSTKNIELTFRSERPSLPYFPPVFQVIANQQKEISFDMPAAEADGTVNEIIALGNNGNDFELWIDSIIIKKKAGTGNGATNYQIALSDFTDKESLRDRILQERGWEFWYEGKRREDLIRMGKYVEVGQQNASNFNEKNLLFPIPPDVLIENPNIDQNPGY